MFRKSPRHDKVVFSSSPSSTPTSRAAKLSLDNIFIDENNEKSTQDISNSTNVIVNSSRSGTSAHSNRSTNSADYNKNNRTNRDINDVELVSVGPANNDSNNNVRGGIGGDQKTRGNTGINKKNEKKFVQALKSFKVSCCQTLRVIRG